MQRIIICKELYNIYFFFRVASAVEYPQSPSAWLQPTIPTLRITILARSWSICSMSTPTISMVSYTPQKCPPPQKMASSKNAPPQKMSPQNDDNISIQVWL